MGSGDSSGNGPHNEQMSGRRRVTSRREFLQAAGAGGFATAMVVAGCSGLPLDNETTTRETGKEYEIVQQGVSAETGSSLVESMGASLQANPELFGVSEVGELQYIDPERYRAVPMRPLEPTEVSDEDPPDRVIDQTPNINGDGGLANLPSQPEGTDVRDLLVEGLNGADVHPEDMGFPGSTSIRTRHSEGALLDTDENVIARSQLDTIAEVYPTLDDIPVVGPGAKIRTTVTNLPETNQPVLTDLRHSFYGVQEGEELDLVGPETAEQRYRERMNFDDTELSIETRLVYYAPALNQPETGGQPSGRIRPYYEVRAEVQQENSYRPFPLRFPAWTTEEVSALSFSRGSPASGRWSGGTRLSSDGATREISGLRQLQQGYRGEFAIESNIFLNMGQNLRTGLQSKGVSEDAYEERFDVDGTDFEAPGDDSQIDRGDLTFEVVHGSSDALFFEQPPNGNNKNKWGDDAADGDWGNNDLEWLIMFNCDTLYPGEWRGCPEEAGWNGPDPIMDRWGDNMDGAHLLLGFRTYGFPGPWQSDALVRYLYGKELRTWFGTINIRSGLPLAKAWHLMLDNYQQNISQGTRDLLENRCLPIGRSTVVAPATRTNNGGWYFPISDRVWGEGTVGRDIPQSDTDGYYIQFG